ncbi:patatin-like phospholipase family protein [Litchfieldia salsa]|uniref:Predicted phospholipase, patatin/cPLA2 family n=1 Tax=Litchfieldia salsa TaxID=930152 RepID=A0A1H0RXD5_9BACI|nr:patatin family protein [Litchfieldia salsa]SDP34120.1 Predicted phospholipase, patatin/cPLA2 family [Litchfieldia salsa]
MKNTGLVLEGGGMRGLYTAGALECFMQKDIFFPYVIGVSAGACMAASYLSRQVGRNKVVNIDYAKQPDYISIRNLIRKREIFGMDYLFDEIPNIHVPYDYDSFFENNEEFMIGTTNCETGEPEYFGKEQYKQKDMLKILRASSSLPLIAPVIPYQGMQLLDGGISDPIPLLKSEEDGNEKHVIILTKNRNYIKSKSKFIWYLEKKYPQYPNLIRVLANRHHIYNERINYIYEQERLGNVFVISPSLPIKVGRIERNPKKLMELYELGYRDADEQLERLMDWV